MLEKKNIGGCSVLWQSISVSLALLLSAMLSNVTGCVNRGVNSADRGRSTRDNAGMVHSDSDSEVDECKDFPDAERLHATESAVFCSHEHLKGKGLEKGLSYDHAAHIPIVFPNESVGVLVAFGFSGPTRGYLLLYRLNDSEAELVQLVEGQTAWGVFGKNRLGAKMHPGFKRRPKPNGSQGVVKLTGSSRLGSQDYAEGVIALIEIKDEGMKEIFRGAERCGLHKGGTTKGTLLESKYEFTDFETDEVPVIIEKNRLCIYELEGGEIRSKVKCGAENKVEYRFDDSRFTLVHGERPVLFGCP